MGGWASINFPFFFPRYVSCDFDKFKVVPPLCRLRDTPAARFYRCIIL